MNMEQDQTNRSRDVVQAADFGSVTPARLEDLTPDNRNANTGTERGRAMVEESLRRYGAGRSVLIDKHGKIMAGNHVVEAAVDIGLTDAVVVKTDGRTLVVVQRTDLDLDSPAGRALAIADNRTSEVGLCWDTDRLAELATDPAVDVSPLFSPVELADLLGAEAPTPTFQPQQPAHRLDELAADTVCPACGHRWHGAPR
jgi:hypothetical protein